MPLRRTVSEKWLMSSAITARSTPKRSQISASMPRRSASLADGQAVDQREERFLHPRDAAARARPRARTNAAMRVPASTASSTVETRAMRTKPRPGFTPCASRER